MIHFLQYLINGLSLGALYALIALGYTMVYGILRFINFAHGDVFMVGAFGGFYLAPWVWKWLPPGEGDVPTALTWAGALVVLLLSMLLCALLGMAIEFLVYRPLRSRPRLTVLITAIGVSLFLENFGQHLFGVEQKDFPAILPDRSLDLFDGLSIMQNQAVTFGVTALVLAALWGLVMRTRTGMAMRALAFNPVAATLVGVNTNAVISITFALGSAIAAAAGILQAINAPSIDPLMGILPGIKAFVAAVLGGIGSLEGAVLGGLILGVLETLVIGYVSPEYKDAVAFTVLILILLFKPAGLLGSARKEKV